MLCSCLLRFQVKLICVDLARMLEFSFIFGQYVWFLNQRHWSMKTDNNIHFNKYCLLIIFLSRVISEFKKKNHNFIYLFSCNFKSVFFYYFISRNQEWQCIKNNWIIIAKINLEVSVTECSSGFNFVILPMKHNFSVCLWFHEIYVYFMNLPKFTFIIQFPSTIF